MRVGATRNFIAAIKPYFMQPKINRNSALPQVRGGFDWTGRWVLAVGWIKGTNKVALRC